MGEKVIFLSFVKPLPHCHFERSEESLKRSIYYPKALGISRRKKRSSK